MEINKWRFTHTHILWSNTFLQLIYHYSYILYFVSFSPPYMIPLLLCQTVTSLCMRPNCANDKLWLEYESEVRWSQVRFLSAAARRHLVVGRMYDSLQENRHQRTVRTAGHPESSQVPYDPQTTDMMVLQRSEVTDGRFLPSSGCLGSVSPAVWSSCETVRRKLPAEWTWSRPEEVQKVVLTTGSQ